ncbi:MAG: helix-turn-helix domain-containing protein [Alphaproteobacteria bacterium]|nr:helix-turn-helix domain-containing protein [Alphaproteobacteria bacterium]
MDASTRLSDLLTKADLANLLGISTRTLDRWHIRRIGPARIRVGHFVFYRPSDVDDWLEQHINL